MTASTLNPQPSRLKFLTAHITTVMALNPMNLPRELLLEVFRAHDNITDVLALSNTCQLLRRIWLSNLRTITDSVLSRQICCYDDASALVEAQRKCVAEAPQSEAYTSTSNGTDGDGPSYPDFLVWLRHLVANDREVEWVSSLAEARFIPSERRGRTTCDVHPAHFLGHERERVARSLYFFRRCVLAQAHPSLQPECQNAIERMGPAELYVLWEMLGWLCDSLDPEIQERLGIWDRDPPEHLIGVQTTFTVPEWDRARDMVIDAYVAKRTFGGDGYETRLHGPCDRCNKDVCGSDMPVKKFWDN